MSRRLYRVLRAFGLVSTGGTTTNGRSRTPRAEEADGEIEFEISFAASVSRAFTINYETERSDAGGAEPGQDYVSTTGSLDFAVGDRSKSATVKLIDDSVPEPTEYFKLVTDSDDWFGVEVTGTGYIIDDDEIPLALIVDPTELDIDEGDATGESFVVRLSREPSADVTVEISGHAGTEVTPSRTSLTFTTNNWETDQPVTVTAGEDDDTVDETVTLALAASGGGYGSVSAEVLVTVIDNDEPYSLQIADAEASESAGEVVFAVTLSGQSASEVTVDFATSDGTAEAGMDYSARNSTLRIAAGSTTAQIRVPILDDAEDESNETFTVQLSAPTGASLADAVATGTILDDEPRISINDVHVQEADGRAAFTVLLSAASTWPVTVDYAAEDITAQAGSDYSLVPGTLEYVPGRVQLPLWVPIIDDNAEEDEESFRVVLSNPRGAGLTRAAGTATIVDDDEAATLVVEDATVGEPDGEVQVAVRLTSASVTEVRVHAATEDATATANADYSPVSEEVVFAPGVSLQHVTVPILDDDRVEDAETFRIRLSSVHGAQIAMESATVTILDDDLPVLSVADVSVLESDARAVFTLSLDRASTRPVRVQYATVDGTATAGEDYLPVSDELMIDPGVRSGTVEVTVIDDARAEEDETFTLALSGASGATLFTRAAEATIRDNDTYRLRVNDVAVGEADGEAVFTVTLDQASPQQSVSVRYATVSGTATSGADFAAQSGVLSFTPGTVSLPVAVPILDDILPEETEDFSLVLSAAQNAEIGDGEGTGTIVDDEVATMSITDARALEDAVQMVFTVSLRAASRVEVSTAYETRAASATEGVDYVRASGRLVFAPGETSKTLSVTLLDDLLDEPDETFVMALSEPGNARYAFSEAPGTIIDDDKAPILSVQSALRVSEGSGQRNVCGDSECSERLRNNGPVCYARCHGDGRRGLYGDQRNATHHAWRRVSRHSGAHTGGRDSRRGRDVRAAAHGCAECESWHCGRHWCDRGQRERLVC